MMLAASAVGDAEIDTSTGRRWLVLRAATICVAAIGMHRVHPRRQAIP
jgi:hypothetical protein